VIHYANKTRIACANFVDYSGTNSTSTNASSSASGSSTASSSKTSSSATGSSSKTSGSATSSSSVTASTGAASQIFANSALVGLVGGIALFAL
jgi:hypothetical protein